MRRWFVTNFQASLLLICKSLHTGGRWFAMASPEVTDGLASFQTYRTELFIDVEIKKRLEKYKWPNKENKLVHFGGYSVEHLTEGGTICKCSSILEQILCRQHDIEAFFSRQCFCIFASTIKATLTIYNDSYGDYCGGCVFKLYYLNIPFSNCENVLCTGHLCSSDHIWLNTVKFTGPESSLVLQGHRKYI